MDAIVSNADAAGRDRRRPAGRALDRLRAKDFAGTLLGFVDADPRRAARAGAAGRLRLLGAVRRRSSELEELRQYRPSRRTEALPESTRGSDRRSPIAMIVNQWVPAAHAATRSATAPGACATCCARMGHESELYALTIDDDLRGDVRPFADPAARRGDVTIFHFALPSPMTEAFAALRARPRPAVPQHHAGGVLRALRSGAVPAGGARPRASWRRWSAGSIWRSATPSSTARSSRRSGFAPTGVLADRRRHVADHQPRRSGRRSSRSSTTAWSTSCSSAASRRTRGSRITSGWPRSTSATSTPTTGSSSSAATTCVPRYYSMIRALMAEYRMLHDRFLFTGPVPDDELAVYYRHAAVYMSLSEHEGFCVPLRRGDGRRRAGAGLRRRPRCPKRWAAPASSSRRRISSSPPNCSARSRSTTACARG